MRIVTWLAIAAVAVSTTACTRGEPRRSRRVTASPPEASSHRRCPRFDDPRRAGSVSGLGIDEISGVAASDRDDVLWIHEDSGADPVIHAIAPDGSDLRSTVVDGATNVDWEDIALAGGNLWIGDIGDNARVRDDGIQVYWFPEPRPGAPSVRASVLRLTYEDGPHDAEALVVDAVDDVLYVITKDLSFSGGTLFEVRIDGLRDGDTRQLTEVGTVPVAIVTAADLSPIGLIVKTYGSGRLFPWTDDRSVGSAIGSDPCPLRIGGGESVAYRRADGAIYAIPEGTSPPVWVSARR
ncbi:MAG TPA: hypothetical protein VLA82_06290 [Actinomycetota bacterium]|nr:hypothetical protein [Actinomycetota bacterium]